MSGGLYGEYPARVQQRLEELCDVYLPQTSQVCRAARYSLLAGGKRVRGTLVLAVCELLGGDGKAAADLAAAVEMLHCYSLIHDDLPCMDNDDFRRGRPSCHKQFGETTALLAGDALLTAAFEAVAGAPLPAQARVQAARALSSGAGARGMILGQELDLQYEGQAITEEQLRMVHRHKTGALINAAVQLGVAAAQGSEEDARCLERYAFGLGLVFQIVDDVLDVEATQEELGKPIGSDQENGKTTFVTLYGAKGARALAAQLNDRACEALRAQYGGRAAFLVALAQGLLVRKN